MNMFLFGSPNPTRILIRGIITAAIGVIIIAVPDLSITSVVKFLGIMLIVDGLTNMIPALLKKAKQQNVLSIIPRGTSAIIFGAIVLLFPQTIVGFFVFLVGFILIVAGGSQLFSQLVGRSLFGFSWVTLLISVIALASGFIMLVNPFKSAVAILFFLGFVIALYGIGEILWSFKIRKNKKSNRTGETTIIDTEYEEVE